MKRIETKRPSVLGRLSRRSNPDNREANFTPLIDSEIIAKAEIRGDKDGFPYLRDLVLVLFALYGNDKMNSKLGAHIPKMISEWASREQPQTRRRIIVKRNFKLRRRLYETALARWQVDAPEDARSATAMAAFLLESYGDGSIEFSLRHGQADDMAITEEAPPRQKPSRTAAKSSSRKAAN